MAIAAERYFTPDRLRAGGAVPGGRGVGFKQSVILLDGCYCRRCSAKLSDPDVQDGQYDSASHSHGEERGMLCASLSLLSHITGGVPRLAGEVVA